MEFSVWQLHGFAARAYNFINQRGIWLPLHPWQPMATQLCTAAMVAVRMAATAEAKAWRSHGRVAACGRAYDSDMVKPRHRL